MTEKYEITIKHMGSTAADLNIDYIIYEAEQCVTLETSAFDSKLIEDFLLSVLKERHGIDAVRDDRTEWNSPRPAYRVYLLLNDVRYELGAHYLLDLGGGKFTVTLKPLAC
ncbi:MAG: hypothetical protein Q8K61_04215 [Gallionella sp.]|nr:hypothetical protein [Gallionella sp.]